MLVSFHTDDDEFYIPRALEIKSEAGLLKEAMSYIYYYDNTRGHSSLDYQTPFSYPKTQLPDIDDKIRFVILIMLDKVSAQLGPWSGYNVLAQHQILDFFSILFITLADNLLPFNHPLPIGNINIGGIWWKVGDSKPYLVGCWGRRASNRC
jgi:hypothetical protein